MARSRSRAVALLRSLPELARAAAICVRRFQDPGQVLAAWARRRPLPSRLVRLRSGMTIHLSADPADIVTVFGVFARETYGAVAPGSTVVDLGANIGVFALFAAWSGAAVVHVYEPSEESYAVLQRNIAANHLEAVIVPHRQAVVGRPTGSVTFPRRSSVLNTIVTGAPASADDAQVPGVTLASILESIGPVDLLKIDCEGAEFDIVPSASREALARVASIKLQYHAGPRDTLTAPLSAHGFHTKQFVDEGARGGYLWLTRDV